MSSNMNRRVLIGSLFAAPMIAKADLLMPVKSIKPLQFNFIQIPILKYGKKVSFTAASEWLLMLKYDANGKAYWSHERVENLANV